jgi:hypothetical protein
MVGNLLVNAVKCGAPDAPIASASSATRTRS